MKVFLRIFSVLVLSSLLVFAVSCNGSNKTPEQSGAVGGDGASASDAEVVAAIKEVLSCKEYLGMGSESSSSSGSLSARVSRAIPDGMNLTSIFQALWENEDFRNAYDAGLYSFANPNAEPVKIDTRYGCFMIDMDVPTWTETDTGSITIISNLMLSVDNVLTLDIPRGELSFSIADGVDTSVEDYTMRYFDTRRYDDCFVEFRAVMTTKTDITNGTELEFTIEISDLKYKGTPRDVTPEIQAEVEQFIKDGYVE